MQNRALPCEHYANMAAHLVNGQLPLLNRNNRHGVMLISDAVTASTVRYGNPTVMVLTAPGRGKVPRSRRAHWSMGSRGERSLPGRDPPAKGWRHPNRAGLAPRERLGSKGQARPLAMGCRGARRLLTGDPTARRWAGGMQRGERSGPLAKIAVLHRTSCTQPKRHIWHSAVIAELTSQGVSLPNWPLDAANDYTMY